MTSARLLSAGRLNAGSGGSGFVEMALEERWEQGAVLKIKKAKA